MEKFAESRALIEAARPGVVIAAAEPVPFEDLALVHSPDYLESIRGSTLAHDAEVRLGLPPCERLLTRCRLETAGTVATARDALDDGIACNLGGGTHHAFSARGEGYCVLNDVVVAIRALRRDEPHLRALVLDTDAHQGNGTHALLAGDPLSFTYSIHVAKNYPSNKVAGTLDVGLPRFVEGSEFLDQLRATVPEALARFPADIVFWVSGADPHRDDRFGQMCLSTEDMMERDRFVIDAVLAAGTPLVVLYGGGYSRTPGLTSVFHTNTILAAAELCARRQRPHPDALSRNT